MADWVDEAQAVGAMLLAIALEGRQRGETGPGAADCADCGEPIPEARRQAMPAATCCTFCQQEREKRGGRGP